MPRIRMPLGSVPDANTRAANKNPESKTPNQDTDVENRPTEAPPTNTIKKRKPTDENPPKKKAKTTPTAREATATLKAAAASLLDVSGVVETGPSGPLPIYDTCDTIRRKIRAMLAKDGVTQADFLRAIIVAAYGQDSTQKLTASSLYSFLKQKGPLAGNTSRVYYAAYVLFEKLRVKQGKAKSTDREIMEEIHPAGVDTTVQSGKISYVIPAGSRLTMDKYGRVRGSW